LITLKIIPKKILSLILLINLSLNCFSQSFETFKNDGYDKFELKDYRGAILDFTKAIELNPSYSGVFYGRGNAKIKLEDKDAGCLDLSKAAELGEAEAYNAIKDLCK